MTRLNLTLVTYVNDKLFNILLYTDIEFINYKIKSTLFGKYKIGNTFLF